MNFRITTAILSALVASGAMAQSASRGDDALTGPERVQMGTEVDAAQNVEVDAQSRGAGNVTSAEAAANPAIVNDEVKGVEDGAITTSRGEDALRGEDVTAEADETGAIIPVSQIDDEENVSRGADNARSSEVATGETDASLVKSGDGSTKASRGAKNATGEEITEGTTEPTEASSSSRGTGNETGSEVFGIDNQKEG